MRGPGSADRLAERLLLQYGLPLAAPVDLRRLAAAMGVTKVRAAPLVEDGRLDMDATTTTITVRAGEPRQRTRFTVAHELGHIVASAGHQVSERRHRTAQDGIERFCDDHAAALLMPHSWVVSQYAEAPACLSTAIDLGVRADVSLSAAVLRLRWVLGWQHGLLRWTRRRGSWGLVGSIGVPRDKRGQLRTTAATAAALESCLAESPGRPTRTRVPMRLGTSDLVVPLEVLARPDAAAALGLLSSSMTTHEDYSKG